MRCTFEPFQAGRATATRPRGSPTCSPWDWSAAVSSPRDRSKSDGTSTRTRKQLVREIARHTQRIQKTLEDANVKLTEVISEILGTSGRAILTALIAGETDPHRLADLTSGRLKASRETLPAALHGRVTGPHRCLLQVHLGQIAALESAVADVEARMGEALIPYQTALNLLRTMPGISATAAAVILGESGDQMSTFPRLSVFAGTQLTSCLKSL